MTTVDDERSEVTVRGSRPLGQLRMGIITGVISTLIVTYLLQPMIGNGLIFLSQGRTVLARWYSRILYHEAASVSELFGLDISFMLSTIVMWIVFTLVVATELRRMDGKRHPVLNATALLWVVVATSVVPMFGISTATTAFQLRESFLHSITIMAPVLTDQEEEELRAEWTSMESRADYERIVARFEALAVERDIEGRPWRIH